MFIIQQQEKLQSFEGCLQSFLPFPPTEHLCISFLFMIIFSPDDNFRNSPPINNMEIYAVLSFAYLISPTVCLLYYNSSDVYFVLIMLQG